MDVLHESFAFRRLPPFIIEGVLGLGAGVFFGALFQKPLVGLLFGVAIFGWALSVTKGEGAIHTQSSRRTYTPETLPESSVVGRIVEGSASGTVIVDAEDEHQTPLVRRGSTEGLVIEVDGQRVTVAAGEIDFAGANGKKGAVTEPPGAPNAIRAIHFEVGVNDEVVLHGDLRASATGFRGKSLMPHGRFFIEPRDAKRVRVRIEAERRVDVEGSSEDLEEEVEEGSSDDIMKRRG